MSTSMSGPNRRSDVAGSNRPCPRAAYLSAAVLCANSQSTSRV